MSIRTENILGEIVAGILWIIVGIGDINKTTPFQIASLVALILIGVIYVAIVFFNSKDGDEMSDFNLLKSKARTFDVLIMAVLLISMATSVTNIMHIDFTVDFQGTMMMTIGIMKLFSGLYFYRFETGKE